MGIQKALFKGCFHFSEKALDAFASCGNLAEVDDGRQYLLPRQGSRLDPEERRGCECISGGRILFLDIWKSSV